MVEAVAELLLLGVGEDVGTEAQGQPEWLQDFPYFDKTDSMGWALSGF